MKRKVSIYIILILLLSLLLAGCSKSPKKELLEALEQSSKIDSHESIIEWDFDFKAKELDNQMIDGLIDNISSNTSLKLQARSDIKNQKSISTLSMGFFGLSIDTEIMVNKDIMAIKSPQLSAFIGDKYLVTKLEDVLQDGDAKQATINMDYLKASAELNKVLRDTLKSKLKDDNIKTREQVKLETPEGITEGKEYIVTLSAGEIKSFVKGFLINALKSKNLRQSIIAFVKTNKDFIGGSISDKELLERPKESIDKILEEFDLEGEIQLNYLVDKSKYIRSSSTVFSLSIKNKESQKVETLSMNAKQKFWNINKKLELNIPEFTEENSIDMKDINNF